MSTLGLGGYSSSEDEGNETHKKVSPQNITTVSNAGQPDVSDAHQAASLTTTAHSGPQSVSQTHASDQELPQESIPSEAAPGPAPRPNFVADDATELAEDDFVSYESMSSQDQRQRLRDLTLPAVPNFDIPDSPPGSPPREATAKFKNFLELKKRGVHFNQRLTDSSALRNPAMMQQLMSFAGVTTADDQSGQYESSLPENLAIQTRWPDWAYTDDMLRAHSAMDKQREDSARGKQRDFVKAQQPDYE